MDFRNISSFVNSPGSDGMRLTPSPPVGSPWSSSGSEGNFKLNKKPKCEGCGNVIHDRWLLHVGQQTYHMACLRCSMCLRTLDSHASCYVRDDQVYCKYHYQSRFSPKCAGCGDSLLPSDWVRKARDQVFHLDCFHCHVCKRSLDTGDTCIVKPEGVVCPDHADVPSHQDDDNISVSSMDSDYRGSESSEERSQERSQSGRKPRTSFTKDQIRILQDMLQRNPNPSPEDMERIADMTGHPRKTVMIWFQNARARSKKLLIGGGNPAEKAHQPKKAGTCNRIASPFSPGNVPFSE